MDIMETIARDMAQADGKAVTTGKGVLPGHPIHRLTRRLRRTRTWRLMPTRCSTRRRTRAKCVNGAAAELRPVCGGQSVQVADSCCEWRCQWRLVCWRDCCGSTADKKLEELFSSLKVQYRNNAVLVINRQTFAALASLKDMLTVPCCTAIGRSIWVPTTGT